MPPSLSHTPEEKGDRRKRAVMLARRWQDSMANNYYTVNRMLLLSVGLWPYQGSGSRRIVITLTTVALISTIAIQFTTFITNEFSVDILLHVLAYSIPWLGYMLKYNVLCFNVKKMLYLMEHVRRDWDELNNAQEIEIIKKYSAVGRFITILTTLFMYMAICNFVIIQVVSNYLFNVAKAANESRIRRIPIMAEYFVDQEKYYTLIVSHLFLLALSGLTTVIATETLYMSYMQHACGLFEIANCRIRKALRENSMQDVASPVERTSICGIISAVHIQRRAYAFIEMAIANFKWGYMLLMPLGVVSLSINLYRFSYLLLSEDYYELAISFMFVLGHFVYMLYGNYIGQIVIDHSVDMFDQSYCTHWYTASLRAQKLLWIIMQRTMRQCVLIIGGVFVPSLEGFARLTSMSISYFMVLLSVQDR